MSRIRWALAAGAVLLPACVPGCSPGGANPDRAVVVDGSSSLYPLSQAVTEEFVRDNPGFRVTVGASGTASGLRRFCDGEVHVAGASRAMTASEAARCRAAGLRYLAIPVARDGVAIVTNAANTAVRCLTLAELRRLWEPSSAVTTWRDLRPALPAEKIRLYGPGPDSGTLRFFTTVVVGLPGASRADHYQTRDDNLIARGVAGHQWALGYFGSARFAGNDDHLRVLGVDTGFGCVSPTPAAVSDGSYSPLSRGLYIYVGLRHIANAHLYAFVVHFVSASETLAVETGYAPQPAAVYARSRALLAGVMAGRMQRGLLPLAPGSETP